jgi:pyruvate/2-oxoacid:ferredoxin oxidoreductase beta subunit
MHKVLVRKGDRFPRCNGCGEAVRFRLIKQAEQPLPMRAKRVRKKSAGR